MSESRKISKASSRFLAKKRSPLFYGTDIPSTISRKEIIDNEIDVVSERKMVSKQAVIKLSPRRLQVMDDGPGISTEAHKGKQTNLWLAGAELFTSSNYEGESDSVGNNGVGLSLGMLTSAKSVMLNFNGENVKGYEFVNGLLKGTPEQIAETKYLEDLEKNFSEEDELYQRINNAFVIKSVNELEEFSSLHEAEDEDDISYVELFEDVVYKGKFYTIGTSASNYVELLSENGYEFDQDKLQEFIKKYENNSIGFETDDDLKLGYILPADEAFEGDYVSKPMSYEEAYNRFNPPYKNGFFVDVTWGSAYDPVFPDGKADLKWLHNYSKKRVGEMVAGGVVELCIYSDDDFTNLVSHDVWTNQEELTKDFEGNISKHLDAARKDIFDKLTDPDKEIEYVPSWLEQTKAYNAVVYRVGDYWIAYSTDEEMQIDSIVQGAPVTSKYLSKQTFNIGDHTVSVMVPTTFKYESTDYPPYSDQTKVRVRYPGKEIRIAFDKTNDVTKYFYRKAEMIYAESLIQNAKEGIFWEALGKPEEAELIIAEGFSAISGVKAQRNRETQACIAIQGKILNCWKADIKYAMRSEEVKQILNAILYTPYKRIVFATDADPDGYHISTLLLGLLYQFTNKIQEGKVCYVNTPYYVFKKRGMPELWSNDANDCPKGYHTSTLKGLGSLTPEQIERFIINEETRDLIYFQDSDSAKSEEALDISLYEGGKRWILD